jgi:hypothetical protein
VEEWALIKPPAQLSGPRGFRYVLYGPHIELGSQ